MKSTLVKVLKSIYFKIIVTLFILNVFPVSPFLVLMLHENRFVYSNANGTFVKKDYIFKNLLFNLSPIVSKNYRDSFPNTTDTLIYRTFSKNPFYIYMWLSYFTEEKYKLPYKSWDDIEKIRPKDLTKYDRFIRGK